MKQIISETPDSAWKPLYIMAGTAAFVILVLYLITPIFQMPAYQPGPFPSTVTEWFALFRNNWLVGLFCLGLTDIFIMIASVFLFLGLCAASMRTGKIICAIALAFGIVGIAVYLSSNTAFPMLSLSSQYAAAATDAQKSALEAAGQALMAKSEALGLAFAWFAAFLLSIGMPRGKLFGKVIPIAGIAGFPLLIASLPFAGYTSHGSVTPAVSVIILATYIGGGLGSIVWYLLVGIRLIRFGFANPKPDGANDAGQTVR
jgi:hypothetical protein